MGRAPGRSAQGAFAARWLPVHRLDRDTSGCLLLARNPKALKRFARAFEERRVEKTYLGIVAGPVHPKRHYRMRTRHLADAHLAPDEWLQAAPQQAGSWWPAWQQWLAAHSGAMTKPPAIGAKTYRAIEDAPGQYVRQH